MKIFYRLHLKVEKFFGDLFEKLGRFIARHPWKAIIIVACLDIGLTFGLFRLETDNSIEQYAPKDTTASKHRDLTNDETIDKFNINFLIMFLFIMLIETTILICWVVYVENMFNADLANNFYQQSLINFGQYATVIVQKKDGGNIVDASIWNELISIRDYVVNTSVLYQGSEYYYTNVCAERFSSCVIDGEYILRNDFIRDLTNMSIPYPVYTSMGVEYSISNTFAKAQHSAGILTSAVAVRFTFNLYGSGAVTDWQNAFLARIKAYKSNIFKLDFAHTDSLDDELYANITSDVTFFAVTFMLMIMFAGFVLFGGNNVSNRYSLGMAGVVSTGLAIVGALGFICLCGVPFASIVGTMPFLIIGIGVDDMFILLSGLADTSHLDDVETRIGKTMRTSGIAVTITSLTDVIAFCAGASSSFPVVKHFSLYTGTAILFCYVNYVTFFLGCMTINERRVSKNRHYLTFKIIKSKETMKEEGKSKCAILCCSGSPHQHRDEVEGPLEKYPKKVVKKIVLFTPLKFVILLLFAGFVGISIYGTVNFQEGLELKDLVSSDSYFYSYQTTFTSLYDQSFSISLNVQSGVDYRSTETVVAINKLRDSVRNDSDIDDRFFISWLHAYRASAYFDDSSDANFVAALGTFLNTVEGNLYINDVTIDGTVILASRFHILTESISSSTRQGKMMLRIREIVDQSNLPVFPFAPSFFYMEQFVAIYPQTMQTLGICVAVVFVITTVFLPLPVMILFITMTVVLIMVSVTGFMHFWGLTLSSVTMIHIIMCIGFCVDFATHICHAFAQVEGTSRNDRVGLALDRSGGPILNGGLSTIIGVLMLAFSKSFIFFSFFKVMFMVMAFGMMYALFLLPVLLSFFGPNYQPDEKKTENKKTENTENSSDKRKNSKNSEKLENGETLNPFTNPTFTHEETIGQKIILPPLTDESNTTHKRSKKRKKKKKKKMNEGTDTNSQDPTFNQEENSNPKND